MKRGQESDSDSDLDDPDVEELEILRRALGTQYTAVSPFSNLQHALKEFRESPYHKLQRYLHGKLTIAPLCCFQEGHDPDNEDESDEEAGVDEQRPTLSDQHNALAQHEGLLSSDVGEDSESSPSGSPHAVPSSSQHGAEPQHGSRAHAADAHTGDVDDENDDEDIGIDQDEGDDEEWEPAPSRAELLRDAVQYLRQASAEQGAVDKAEGQHDDAPLISALTQVRVVFLTWQKLLLLLLVIYAPTSVTVISASLQGAGTVYSASLSSHLNM